MNWHATTSFCVPISWVFRRVHMNETFRFSRIWELWACQEDCINGDRLDNQRAFFWPLTFLSKQDRHCPFFVFPNIAIALSFSSLLLRCCRSIDMEGCQIAGFCSKYLMWLLSHVVCMQPREHGGEQGDDSSNMLLAKETHDGMRKRSTMTSKQNSNSHLN
jgi:hypothetical protein